MTEKTLAGPWYNDCMPSYFVETPHCRYPILVERGGLANVREYIPERAGKVFLISTEDVWKLHGERLATSLGQPEVLFFPGGEPRKRLAEVETLAEQMVARGGDRASIVVALGGGNLYRCGGIPGRHLHARHSGDSDSHYTAGAGGRGGGRENRREPDSRART